MRESFVFYESFYLAISELSATQQGKIFQAICRYALYGEEPELKGASSAVFKLIKPQIDANNRRYENGKRGAEHGIKGGRPKNPKETPKKPLTNPKETPNVTVHVTDNVNDNVPVTDNDNAQGGGGSSPDDDRFNIFKLLGGDGIDKIYDKYPNTGGDLIQEVYEEVRDKKTEIKNPVAYVLGYAKNKKWSDGTDDFVAPWEAM